ncbi:MAG: hypothetical protein JSS61_07720 [Verrucomicrobia bacterium]|nr:hypothetical protein [Verrucomicrobiota bacterium]
MSSCGGVSSATAAQFTDIHAGVWGEYVNLEEHRLSFEGMQLPNSEDVTQAASDLASHVEGNEGVSVIAIPQGLSFSKLVAIANEKQVPIWHISSSLECAIGAVETKTPYIAVISNSVLDGTRGYLGKERITLIQEKGYEVPLTIELLTEMVFHYIMHSKRLFSDDPCTYSITSDRQDRWWQPIGQFGKSGFYIPEAVCTNALGAAGVRRFQGSSI